MASMQLPSRETDQGNAVTSVNGAKGDVLITGTNGIGVVANGTTLTIGNGQNTSSTATPTFGGLVLTGKTGALYGNAGAIEAGPLANGQILVGRTGNTPVPASITGTTNQVSVTVGSGSITLGLPQDIHAAASPTFSAIKMASPGVGVGTTVIRDGSGNLRDLTSSVETKENIRPLHQELPHDVLQKLKPVAYNYVGQDPEEDVTFGFLAEDVAQVCESLVIFRDGKPYSLQYSEFIPILVAHLQAQHTDAEFQRQSLERITHFVQVSREESSAAAVRLKDEMVNTEGRLLNLLGVQDGKVGVLQTSVAQARREADELRQQMLELQAKLADTAKAHAALKRWVVFVGPVLVLAVFAALWLSVR